jgi:hypothetical protein
MNDKNSAYFRQRAQYHFIKAERAENGVACIHRRFALLYSEKANQAERARRTRRAELRQGSHLRSHAIPTVIATH